MNLFLWCLWGLVVVDVYVILVLVLARFCRMNQIEEGEANGQD